ncbi:hypothetical protein K469DRAFT_702917 [Zopfia rhizophila CBS 207.26]|uniref:Uncharacterized protein n=1 Tax=Zopfia rhizophila CBS 207.26 TaxID=1314779 RepID=A0A6A6D741_9PEZI|nr:hypothetical protein K469DRAFT_702917 [Zopfia rhizophila CBS 207.26]
METGIAGVFGGEIQRDHVKVGGGLGMIMSSAWKIQTEWCTANFSADEETAYVLRNQRSNQRIVELFLFFL